MWGSDWGVMIWGQAALVPLLGPVGLIALVSSFLAGSYFLQSRRRARRLTVLSSVALVVLPLAAIATTVPNTFVNGTVADADQVNANFDAILDDFSKYNLILDASNAGTSVKVPDAIFDALCRDDDGCRIRVASLDYNGLGAAPFVAPSVLLYYQTTELAPGVFAYSTETLSGLDGNGSLTTIVNTGDSNCYVQDGSYVAFAPAGDTALGLNLLLWNGTGNPDRRCSFSIID